jgi:hypothetical protein
MFPGRSPQWKRRTPFSVLCFIWRPLMLRTPARSIVSVLTTALLLAPSSFAFDSPLSDQAVREAYFLGQRRDESLARFFDKYTRYLPPPKTGPHISSIAFFTPFAVLTQLSSQHTFGYSAQQAALDHRDQQESVRIVVQILLTDSYPAYIPRPGSRPGSPTGFAPRPFSFWKNFQVQVFAGDKALEPFSSSGEPDYICSEYGGGCTLIGATLQFEFPAEDFATDSVTIEVKPPEGDPVSVDFDLTSLR